MKKQQHRQRRKRQHVRPQYGGSGPGSVDPRQCDNELLLQYYRAQHIVEEEEWPAFERSLRTSLPMVLRLLRSRPGWERTLADLRRRGDGVVFPLAWCAGSAPGALVWQCASSAYSAHAGGELRRWSQQQSSRGTVSFQEAVSMLPPLLLAPHPDHLVLDMCAAPGSKTMQLLDSMHALDEWDCRGCPRVATGLLVAADVSSLKMTSVVAGRLRKIHSPVVALAVGNSKHFPFLHQRSASPGVDELTEPVLFDRILCDVPCTGDGTIRKNPSIWSTWSLGYALELHTTQLRLLRRGLRLLRPGGRLVYSTCSINPIENEAVVLSALRAFPGRVSLEDASALAPLVPAESYRCSDDAQSSSLRVKRGLESWCVPDIHCAAARARAQQREARRSTAGNSAGERRAGDWECTACGANVFAYKLSCFKCNAPKPSQTQPEPEQELEKQVEPEPEERPDSSRPQEETVEETGGKVVFSSLADVPEEMLRRHTPGAPLLSSMFPDRPQRAAGDGVDGDEATDASLRAMLTRCIRVLPHHNDTGGFFVAVFRRDIAEGSNGREEPGKDDDKQQEVEEDHEDNEEPGQEQEHAAGGASSPDTSTVGHGAGCMFYAKQRYALMDSDDGSPMLAAIWSSIAEFYGLPATDQVDQLAPSTTIAAAASSVGDGGHLGLVRRNLAVVFDPDGEARKIDLLSPALREFLCGNVGDQKCLQFVSLGMRAFKRLEPGFLKPARCRWRPCHESAEYIGQTATRRRLRLAREPLIEFLTRGRTDVEQLYELERNGLAVGLAAECDAWPELTAQSIGGVVVGCLVELPPTAATTSQSEAAVTMATAGRIWVAGALTGKQLESYADKAELAMALELLEH